MTEPEYGHWPNYYFSVTGYGLPFFESDTLFVSLKRAALVDLKERIERTLANAPKDKDFALVFYGRMSSVEQLPEAQLEFVQRSLHTVEVDT